MDGFEPVINVEELVITDAHIGEGGECQRNSTVVAHYTGALCANGEIFQSSHDSGKPLTFNLFEVIAGWHEGLQGMKVGGKRRLVIPSNLAYGSSSPSKNIPKNSDLVFDVELIDIK